MTTISFVGYPFNRTESVIWSCASMIYMLANHLKKYASRTGAVVVLKDLGSQYRLRDFRLE